MTIPGIGGRPRAFTCPIELEKRIQEYFKSCWEYKPINGMYGLIKDTEVMITDSGDSEFREGDNISKSEIEEICFNLRQEDKNEPTYEVTGNKCYVKEWRKKHPYTIEGLCAFLGKNRDTIWEYENGVYDDREECKDIKYSDIISRYKAVIDSDVVNRMLTDRNANLRFYAINRLGMKNEQHITSDNKNDNSHNFKGDMTIEIVPRKD